MSEHEGSVRIQLPSNLGQKLQISNNLARPITIHRLVAPKQINCYKQGNTDIKFVVSVTRMLNADTPTRSWGLHGNYAVATLDRSRRLKRPDHTLMLDLRPRHKSTSSGASARCKDSYQAGLFGEEIVADHLQDSGWRIIGHRIRTHLGEIDLVARRGSTIVFAEVKSAKPSRISVEESVSLRARHRIRRTALLWISSNQHMQRGVRQYRFDVFIVRRAHDGSVEQVEHVPDAF